MFPYSKSSIPFGFIGIEAHEEALKNQDDDCAFYFYAPDDQAKDVWDDFVPIDYFVRHTVGAEPRSVTFAPYGTMNVI